MTTYNPRHKPSDVEKVITMKEEGYSNRAVAKTVFGSKSKCSTVSDIYTAYRKGQLTLVSNNTKPKEPKILFLDLEIAPTIAAVFNRYKTNVGVDAVLEEPYILTVAHSLLNEDEVTTKGIDDFPLFRYDTQNDYQLVEYIRDLINDADIVVAHNAKFDKGWFNQQLANWNLSPPQPYKLVCTLNACRKHFNLPANSLDAACKYFGLGRKVKHKGMSLWLDCKKGDLTALAEMKKYNKGDIPTLKELYLKVRPFMNEHPNVQMYYDEIEPRCRVCGSTELTSIKETFTPAGKFSTCQCKECGATSKTSHNLLSKEEKQALLKSA